MKYTFVILATIIISAISCFGQTIIEMEEENGVYNVPCKVNGVKMKFIFDSGAATVCLSESMADYLYGNGYITIDDVIGVGKSQVADGRIVENVRINLRDIEIAGMHLHNVEGVVIIGLKGSLLLGQTAIQALGRVTIDGNKLVIHNASQSLSENQIIYLRKESLRLIEEGDYRAALVHLKKLYNNDACDFIVLYEYAYSLSQDKQYDEAIVVTNKWFDLYELDAPGWMRYRLYKRQVQNYYSKTYPDYREANNWIERQINLASIVFEDEKEKDDELFSAYMLKGTSYLHLEQFSSSKDMYEKAFNIKISYYECNKPNDVKKIKDEHLGACAYGIATCYYHLNDISKYTRSLAIAARLGCEQAISQCKKNNIKY